MMDEAVLERKGADAIDSLTYMSPFDLIFVS